MEYPGCRGEVFSLIEEASYQFSQRFIKNVDRMADIEEVCSLVDELVVRQECYSVDVHVDDAMGLTFSLTGEDMTIHRRGDDPFLKLLGLVNSFSFYRAKGDRMGLDLRVEGLWEAIG